MTNVCANITTSLVKLSFPNWTILGWHTLLVMYGYLIIFGAMNMYLFWIIPWLEFLAGLLHVILWVVFATVLLTLAPQHTTDFVFWEHTNTSGWTNDYVAFSLGTILITWGFVGKSSNNQLVFRWTLYSSYM